MSYAQYLRTQASECVDVAIESSTDEAASLLDLAQDYHHWATAAEPAGTAKIASVEGTRPRRTDL